MTGACRAVQEKWMEDSFLIELKGKPVCLICNEAFAIS